MLNDFNGADHMFIKCGYADLRLGIDSQSILGKQEMEPDFFGNTLFPFCGRRRD